MRHGKSGKKFGLDKAARKALMRNLAKQLFIYGRIRTTVARAKYLRTIVEPIITRAKGGTLNDIREVYKYIDDRDMIKKIFSEVAPLYKDRKGGYTRVLKLGNRPGDNAEMAIIELIDATSVYKKEEPKKDEKAKKEGEQKQLKEAKKEKPKKEEKPVKTEKKEEKKEKKEEKKEEKKPEKKAEKKEDKKEKKEEKKAKK